MSLQGFRAPYLQVGGDKMFEAMAKRFTGQEGPLEYGKGLKGEDKGGKAPLRDFIGQRGANAQNIPGIRKGRGNRVEEEA